MEMIPKRYETVADIPVDEFLPLQKNTEEEREQITAPSLNFIQDSWRRLKKNKVSCYFNGFTIGHHFDLCDHNLCFSS